MGGNFSYNDASNDFVLNENNSLVVLGSAFVTADNFFNRGRIDVADNFHVAAGDGFYNYATISANNFNVTAGRFFNTGGSITADTFALSVAGDFDYTNNYLNNGNIDATALNFRIGGDFFYDDASNNFVWNAQNSLVVLGSAFVTTDNFTNYGDIIADSFALSVAGDFDYASDFGNIDATNFNSPSRW